MSESPLMKYFMPLDLCGIVVQQAQDPADTDDDGDSALGHDAPGSTASLSESIFNYRKHYGRTFHAERDNAQYWGANDQKQSEAMDILHHTVTLFQEGKLYQAPLKSENVKVRCAPIIGFENAWVDVDRPGEESP